MIVRSAQPPPRNTLLSRNTRARRDALPPCGAVDRATARVESTVALPTCGTGKAACTAPSSTLLTGRITPPGAGNYGQCSRLQELEVRGVRGGRQARVPGVQGGERRAEPHRMVATFLPLSLSDPLPPLP